MNHTERNKFYEKAEAKFCKWFPRLNPSYRDKDGVIRVEFYIKFHNDKRKKNYGIRKEWGYEIYPLSKNGIIERSKTKKKAKRKTKSKK
tara:strand:+ start:668 stop:934 length:267 start_codon:yes stop_codon:yes gene_type:complete